MKLIAVTLLALAGCGALGSTDNESFDVLVHDASNSGIANAIITLNMSESTSDHVCATTDSRGDATVTWNSCQFGFNDCSTTPYSIMAAASGYTAMTQSVGFSQSESASIELEACDEGATCPDPTPCTN